MDKSNPEPDSCWLTEPNLVCWGDSLIHKGSNVFNRSQVTDSGCYLIRLRFSLVRRIFLVVGRGEGTKKVGTYEGQPYTNCATIHLRPL